MEDRRRHSESYVEAGPCRPSPEGEGGRPRIFVGPLHPCYRIVFSDPA